MTDPKESNDNSDGDTETNERHRREREEELCDTFRMFDVDKSGYISAEELGRVLINFSGLNQDQVGIILKQADIDRDGEVIQVT